MKSNISSKHCVICGEPGKASLKGLWLCETCAIQATNLRLNSGQPVVWAHRGKSTYLLLPAAFGKN